MWGRVRLALVFQVHRLIMRPMAKSTLADEVKRAQQIVSLEDDWDGEGAQGYSQDTFNRAVKVLGRFSSAVREGVRS